MDPLANCGVDADSFCRTASFSRTPCDVYVIQLESRGDSVRSRFHHTSTKVTSMARVHRGRITRALWLHISLCAAAVFLAACSGPTYAAPRHPRAPEVPPDSPRLDWIVSSSAISLLEGAGMSRLELDHIFGHPDTFLISDNGREPGPGWKSTLTLGFADFAALAHALRNLPASSKVRAILYDDEHWVLTPLNQQQHPTLYEHEAAILARAHHLLFVATPARSLALVLAPGSPRNGVYHRLDFAGGAAQSANVVDIQAQGLEGNPAAYASFVQSAAVQARRANPSVIVLAGISTNPNGRAATASEILAAIQATRRVVDGYWLNIPAAGVACPHCGRPRPEVAAAVLRKLYGLR